MNEVINEDAKKADKGTIYGISLVFGPHEGAVKARARDLSRNIIHITDLQNEIGRDVTNGKPFYHEVRKYVRREAIDEGLVVYEVTSAVRPERIYDLMGTLMSKFAVDKIVQVLPNGDALVIRDRETIREYREPFWVVDWVKHRHSLNAWAARKFNKLAEYIPNAVQALLVGELFARDQGYIEEVVYRDFNVSFSYQEDRQRLTTLEFDGPMPGIDNGTRLMWLPVGEETKFNFAKLPEFKRRGVPRFVHMEVGTIYRDRTDYLDSPFTDSLHRRLLCRMIQACEFGTTTGVGYTFGEVGRFVTTDGQIYDVYRLDGYWLILAAKFRPLGLDTPIERFLVQIGNATLNPDADEMDEDEHRHYPWKPDTVVIPHFLPHRNGPAGCYLYSEDADEVSCDHWYMHVRQGVREWPQPPRRSDEQAMRDSIKAFCCNVEGVADPEVWNVFKEIFPTATATVLGVQYNIDLQILDVEVKLPNMVIQVVLKNPEVSLGRRSP